MNTEIKSLVSRIENINNGDPWFGRSVFKLLDEIDASKIYERPGKNPHSIADILYHMITWAEFTLKRIEKDKEYDLAASELLDWRKIDPKQHTLKKGLKELKDIQKKIVSLLLKKEDSFLEEKVDFRKYNFRYLINGMIEHNIYHAGQIAYLNKLL